MIATTDRQRSAVYAAEVAAFDGTDLEMVVGIDVVKRTLDMVVAGEWWPGPDVSTRPSRRDAIASSTRCPFVEHAEIRLAAGQATLATGAHELAHALAGVISGHDAVFRRAHIDVTIAITNLDRLIGRGLHHANQLIDAYAAAGLVIGNRRWAAPQVCDGPIPL